MSKTNEQTFYQSNSSSRRLQGAVAKPGCQTRLNVRFSHPYYCINRSTCARMAALLIRATRLLVDLNSIDQHPFPGMMVTAEGIEQPDQLAALVSQGCREGQGFLFGEAVPATAATLLLHTPKRILAT
jgi:hypothetical protein